LDRTSGFPFVADYLAGSIPRDDYVARVVARADELEAAGLSRFEIKKLSMFPPDERVCAAGMLEAMAAAGLVDDPTPRDAEFDAYREQVDERFRHLDHRHTYIFPDEARGAFELSMAIHPKRVVVCGAYYNYLAVWLVPGLAPAGRMLCLDIDCSVSGAGRANMERLGFADRVDTICRDAEELLLEGEDPIDLLVLDATGPNTHPDSRYHGKSIYGPLLAAARPRMPSGGWVLAHNADQGSPLLAEFYERVADATFTHYLGTTDDLAVFRLP
jgi:predicted O-methyltransferase YrrM